MTGGVATAPQAHVSVIVPNYNHARFLPQRIESILGQTFTELELLILDDCSTDDSRAVIARYESDPRVRVHLNDRNVGSPYPQWQRGLAMTTGDYVWIAESDDFADRTFLAQLVSALDAHPTAGIAVAETTVVDVEGDPIGPYFGGWDEEPAYAGYLDYPRDRVFAMGGRDYCRRYMVPWNTIPNASGALFRRSAFAAVGGPELGMRICGDWLTYCRMLMQYDIVRVPEPLNFFRRVPTSVSHGGRPLGFVAESLAVTRYVERELGRGHGGPPRRLVRDAYCHILLLLQRRPDGTLPVVRIPDALRTAARYGPAMLASMALAVARMTAGQLRRRLSGSAGSARPPQTSPRR